MTLEQLPIGKRLVVWLNEKQLPFFRLGLLFPIDIGGLISVRRLLPLPFSNSVKETFSPLALSYKGKGALRGLCRAQM